MTAALIGIALGLAIGVACRLLDIPLPAPPKLVGALLVLAMTLGYVGIDAMLASGETVLSALTARPESPWTHNKSREFKTVRYGI